MQKSKLKFDQDYIKEVRVQMGLLLEEQKKAIQCELKITELELKIKQLEAKN